MSCIAWQGVYNSTDGGGIRLITFTIWCLKRARTKVERKYAREREKMQKKHAPETDIDLTYVHELIEARVYTQQIALKLTSRLEAEAERFDVEVPEIDVEGIGDTGGKMWEPVIDSAKVGVQEGRVFLSSKGRAHLRRLIEEEKRGGSRLRRGGLRGSFSLLWVLWSGSSVRLPVSSQS